MSEFDSSAAAFKGRARALAELLATSEDRARLWRPDELAAIFRHQLAAPMLVDLGGFDVRTAARLELLSGAQGLLLKSLADLIHHPSPPVELLEVVKDFAKANLDHPESGLPGEIASALYYLSIASAQVRLGVAISQLSATDLRRGWRWLMEQPWLDGPNRELLAKALETVPGKEPGNE